MSTEPDRPAGVWLGVDVGTVRIGVARSDPRGSLAVPVETVPADRRGRTHLARVADLVREYDAVGVVVGLPLTLAGRAGPSAEMAQRFAADLSENLGQIPVRMVDERLSTVVATRRLTDRGVRGRAGRQVIDQAAAVEILQSFLDSRGSGASPDNPSDVAYDQTQRTIGDHRRTEDR